jgi:dTDP-N-acetylfucosamine:lipid II N-acetylfucosaminyltransferase
MYHVFLAGKSSNQINYYRSFKKLNPSKDDFYLISNIISSEKKENDEILITNFFYFFYFLLTIPKNSKVIFHDFSNIVFPFFLYFFKYKINYSWVIWGWDLYILKNGGFKNNIKIRSLRYFKNIYGFKQDFKFLSSIIKNNFNFKEFVYAPPTWISDPKFDYNIIQKKESIILVGHSASPENRHIECFDFINNSISEKFVITCILSYGGSEEYINNVIEKGYSLFGDNFNPILDFMSPNDFNQFLSKINFAFLFNKRQAAVGFIYSCLMKSIQIFMYKDSTPFEFLSQRGVTLHDIEMLHKENLEVEREVICKNNFTEICKIYSKGNLKNYYNTF